MEPIPYSYRVANPKPRPGRSKVLGATRRGWVGVKIAPSGGGDVDLHDSDATNARFRAYAADLGWVLGHADRVRPFADDCTGLLAAEGRKSVEPLAAVTAPARTATQN